ncbi:hypothetical protein NE237_030260 [Protea cynaroides]|uniref:Uncharacterized protein n=1 Tax=Protea cynaroides TaxID=273540 RepID=A0A9Q0GTD6_9MAGN|nr:hypothetical protein NE237_030260 [Protea cynaroides]
MGGCMGALVKMVKSLKPAGLQDVAAQALVSLLSVRPNRKDLARDEKSVLRLVQMLDPQNELVSKKLLVLVISAIMAGGGKSFRKRIAKAGAFPFLPKLAEEVG